MTDVFSALRPTLSPRIALPLAAFFLGLSVVLWWVLVRPVPVTIHEGRVVAVDSISARTLRSQHVQAHRSLERTPRERVVRVGPRLAVRVALQGKGKGKGKGKEIVISEPPTATWRVGDRVRVKLQTRRLLFLYRNVRAVGIERVP